MDSNNPFSLTSSTQGSLHNQRRSTRIKFVSTVLLSGKDADGAPFREFTQTSSVNLHGCNLRTSYRIMVGMVVTLECPKAGTWGKGICVRVWDSPQGVAWHEIAVQLEKPQNLWGVPNPPDDWEVFAKARGQGQAAQNECRVRSAALGAAQSVEAACPPRPSEIPQAVNAAAPAPASTPQPLAQPAGPSVEDRLSELERCSTQLMEFVLDMMRGQTEALPRNRQEESPQQEDGRPPNNDPDPSRQKP